jgi:hypothetical protein
MVEMRFTAPDDEKLVKEIIELIERCGGEVQFAGRPRENLESLFHRLLAPDRGGSIEA